MSYPGGKQEARGQVKHFDHRQQIALHDKTGAQVHPTLSQQKCAFFSGDLERSSWRETQRAASNWSVLWCTSAPALSLRAA
ncbi:hypothetical protein [Nitrosomonas halophila]|uniref:Uncharacterized protein n=1 Tax=Nitrosomonas halophila TaxID=44576 RepID=A0A1H3LER5_9PROT|nr:hypothetical protein [Nitrosomonas halophila]SDY62893.1 hypothetical protein SAMN05421881_104811 [Nitrosomonas halophila]